MKKFKIRKSLSKRFKVTKTGKVLRRGKPPVVVTGKRAAKIKKLLGK